MKFYVLIVLVCFMFSSAFAQECKIKSTGDGGVERPCSASNGGNGTGNCPTCKIKGESHRISSALENQGLEIGKSKKKKAKSSKGSVQ